MTGLCDMCACACACVCVCVLSYVQLFVTPWTEAPPGSSVPGIFPGMKVFLVAQSCLTVCDPMDCSLPASSVYGILQARILE